MQYYILRRLLSGILVLALVSVVVFSMLQLVPGDPVMMMLGESSTAGAQDIERLRHQLGLDQPLHVQYLTYVSKAVQGDLGRSIRSSKSVSAEISGQLPATIQLTLAGLGLAIVIGVGLGLVAALHHNGWGDNLSMVFALIGVSVPNFWLGLLLIFLFSLRLEWLPATGVGGPERLILPAVTLGLWAAGLIARLTRSSMLEVLRQDYIVTARSKGLREQLVLTRHALRNALLPVVTMVGLQFGHLLGGAVIIETVFARSGLGRLLVTSIVGKDFPMVQGIVLFSATIYVLVNLAIDISYTFLDPRIRYVK